MPELTTELPPVAATTPAATAAPVRAALAIAPVLSRLEAALAIVGTLLVVYLHVFFFQHVGGLWRDETNSVSVATMPSLGAMWDSLQFDSFPILFFGVLRAWAGIFGSMNDTAFRALGMLIGLGVVGALWLNARLLGVRWPLFSLVLLGFNPMFVRYGDSMRAYGLGMLLILLTLAAVWRVLENPRPRRVALAVLAALLSAQTLYYNSVLLFAICVAGAVTAARERRWKTAACILGVGAPAAASLVIYAGTISRLHEWNFLVQWPVTLPWLWHKLGEVTGAPDPLGVWVWSALFLGALGVAGWWLWHRRPATVSAHEKPEPVNRAVLFAASALVVLTVGYPIFLKALNYYTQPWYYVSFVALVAVGVEVIFGRVLAATGSVPGRVARLVFFVALTALVFPQTREMLFKRQTSVDLAAGQMNRMAAPEDLIVSNRWECTIPFERYYKGKTPVMSLPPMDDHRVHRYDLVKAQMMTPDAAGPVLAQMEATLRAGHRVWLLGPLIGPPPGRHAPQLPPAKIVNGKFVGGPFYEAWAEQAGFLLRQHAVEIITVPVSNGQPVVDYEDLPLTGFQGWH